MVSWCLVELVGVALPDVSEVPGVACVVKDFKTRLAPSCVFAVALILVGNDVRDLGGDLQDVSEVSFGTPARRVGVC